ncbi:MULTISPECIES: IucA/IucC family C-terminal-domain containing protein [unclassified Pseudomonas]|uniref:IucA/IucC family C-terminal-domain containing protein n=1 Tax=unclassified Pseudomonas TaxID=196821 RepID=UPI001011E816|nr:MULTISPECIES: IucA/IucC family C-terminal-domain containing protein [unclassified Pseudomonas]QAY92757.1 siderophore-iron reductase, Fe-S cluster protein [Pseudomonas sp. ACM7]TFB39042.1 siderophore-iron reductase, Fe-S cluster protein [Pseudomonas sp. F01002]
MSLARHFTAQEWSVLGGGLRLKDCAERDPLRSLMARDLLQEDVCERLLDALSPVIGSPSRAITASLLGKRLSFLATGACLYAMSVYDKGLLLSLDNTVIEYGHDDGLWTSSMPLAHSLPLTYGAGEREAWRETLVQSLFAGLLKPLWQTFNRVSGVSRRILWENSAVRVYSLYEKRMAKIDEPSVRERYEADFRWLLTQAEPALFGLDYNPLSHFRRPPTLLDEGQRSIRFRRTCCFYYLATEPAEYCSTCPLLRPGKCR